MLQVHSQAAGDPDFSNRVFSPHLLAFFVAMHLCVIAVFWQTTWGAIAVAIGLHMLCGGLGIGVGYHRLLTHHSFKCSRLLEYSLALVGSLALQGGPVEWVAWHRKHHKYTDKSGDPHSAAEGFWWSHILWMLHKPEPKVWKVIRARYAPDLQKQRFYRIIEHTHFLGTALLALLLFKLGGWPWVVWGIAVRLVATYHITWFVNSASHMWGYKNFASDDLSTNNWWVALLSMGEGWHNNHHAFPTSARHGMRFWEVDFSYYFIRSLKAIGLAWEVHVPSAEKMKEKLLQKADSISDKLTETANELGRKADAISDKLSETADELGRKADAFAHKAEELAENLSPQSGEARELA